jgi:hypothetical protein
MPFTPHSNAKVKTSADVNVEYDGEDDGWSDIEALPNWSNRVKSRPTTPSPSDLNTASIPIPSVGHPDVEFVVESEYEAPPPDNGFIKAKADRYYPLLIGRLAPEAAWGRYCSSKGCESTSGPFYRCKSCLCPRWYCQVCIVAYHEHHPFHRISKWEPSYGCMVEESLADAGLVIKFDHVDGSVCTSVTGKERFIDVIHTDGTHKIRFHQCTCDGPNHRTVTPEQLLANGLFPATDSSPQWAFSFGTLDLYNSLDLSGFINIKQFLDGIMELGRLPEEVSAKLQ